MKRILFSPFCRPLRNGGRHPKNYPYWDHVIRLLKFNDCSVFQIGQENEYRFPDVDGYLWGLRLRLLASELQKCDTWASVDNFFHHFACYQGKPGVVIFGQQDPDIFGHPSNINLLKDRSFIRPNIWQWWEDVSCRDDCWIEPLIVADKILELSERPNAS